MNGVAEPALGLSEFDGLMAGLGPFEPALKALAGGAIRPEETVDRRFPLREAAAAFAFAEQAGVRKVLLDVN